VCYSLNVVFPNSQTIQIMSIRIFRIIAVSEGISFLTLLLIAMPIKYLLGMPEAVKIVGWIHGILFISYIPGVFLVRKSINWNIAHVGMALIASILPGGTFILDYKLLRKSQ